VYRNVVRRGTDKSDKGVADGFCFSAVLSVCLFGLTAIFPRGPGLAGARIKVEQRKASSLDIAPLTILNSGALQPRKWQLTGNDCSTAAHAVAAQSPR